MEIIIEKQDGRTLIRIEGDLITVYNTELNQALHRILEDGGGVVVMDLSESHFIESGAISLLVGFIRGLRFHGRSFEFSAVSPRIRHIFDMTNMWRFIEKAGHR